MNLQFGAIASDIPYILKGIWVTLEFTLLSAVFGFLWGTVLAILKISNIRIIEWLAMGYTSIFRGTPLLVQLTLIYFAVPQLFNYDIQPLQAGVIGFSLNSAAYISESIRGGILSVDKGQREAAMALGVPYRRMMIDIILPQAVKNILPALVNESIALLKDSALVSTIGVLDILRRAQIIASNHSLYFEPLLVAAGVYYVIITFMTWVSLRVERRMRRSD